MHFSKSRQNLQQTKRVFGSRLNKIIRNMLTKKAQVGNILSTALWIIFLLLVVIGIGFVIYYLFGIE